MSEALRLAERCESLASIAGAYSEEAYDAAAELRRLHAENERLREALRWRPIETAPRDGTEVLVNAGNCCYVVAWIADDIEWWCVDDNKLGPFRLRGMAPTHWMPLPDAP